MSGPFRLSGCARKDSRFLEGLHASHDDSGDKARVVLEEDSISAFQVFLDVSHLRNDQVPHSLDFGQMSGLRASKNITRVRLFRMHH